MRARRTEAPLNHKVVTRSLRRLKWPRSSPRDAGTPGGMADTCLGGIDMAKPICSQPECPTVVYAHGICRHHYDKERKKWYKRPVNAVCHIKECDRPATSRGMCSSHYSRWYRYGDPRAGQRNRFVGDTDARFWQKVDTSGDCWEWTGAISDTGYGAFRLPSGELMSAHRFAYRYLVGPIPNGLVIDHLCENPSCVNPDHLEPVTHGENLRRAREGR